MTKEVTWYDLPVGYWVGYKDKRMYVKMGKEYGVLSLGSKTLHCHLMEDSDAMHYKDMVFEWGGYKDIHGYIPLDFWL